MTILLNFRNKPAFVMIPPCIMRTGRDHWDSTISSVSYVQGLEPFLMKKNAFVLVMAKNIPKSMLLEKSASV